MKIKLIFENHYNGNFIYTIELIKKIIIANNHILVDSYNECDLIAISSISIQNGGLEWIKKITSKIKKEVEKPIVIGGHATSTPMILLKYVDYVNIGHGFEFFEKCKSINDIEKQPFILKRGDTSVFISQKIDWKLEPLVQIGKKNFYYWIASGCKNKCTYCSTTHFYKHQKNNLFNNEKINKIKKKIGKNNLILITNEFNNDTIIKTQVIDSTFKQYIENPKRYNNIGKIRMGIEFPTEALRKKTGKPISNDEIKEVVKISKKYNKHLGWFFIAGLNTQEEFEFFKENLLYDNYTARPQIEVMINYFITAYNTPLGKNFNIINNYKELDLKRLQYIWSKTNSRIRIGFYHVMKPYSALIKSLIERCSWETNSLENILKLKKEKFQCLDDFYDKCRLFRVDHLLIKPEYELKLIKSKLNE